MWFNVELIENRLPSLGASLVSIVGVSSMLVIINHLLGFAMSQSTVSTHSLVSFIEEHQLRQSISDEDLALDLGYSSADVLRLVKQGALLFPLEKILILAEALNVDPAETFRAAMSDMPVVLTLIDQLYPMASLTVAERNLIMHLRELSGGREFCPVVFDGKPVIALMTS